LNNPHSTQKETNAGIYLGECFHPSSNPSKARLCLHCYKHLVIPLYISNKLLTSLHQKEPHGFLACLEIVERVPDHRCLEISENLAKSCHVDVDSLSSLMKGLSITQKAEEPKKTLRECVASSAHEMAYTLS
jgi:hypothetical protein